MGHPVHPLGFRVGKTIPWVLRTHRYERERFGLLGTQRHLRLYLRKKFYRLFPLRKFKLLALPPKFELFAGHTRVTFPIFNVAYDAYLRRGLYNRERKRTARFRAKTRRQPRSRRKLSSPTVQPRTPYVKILFRKKGPRLLQILREKAARKKKEDLEKLRAGIRPRLRASRRNALLGKFQFLRFLYDKRRVRHRYQFARRSRRFYLLAAFLLATALRTELARILPGPVRIRLAHIKYENMPAELMASYIIRRLRLNYSLNHVLRPLLEGIRATAQIKGFLLKLKGRFTRKPRAAFNTRLVRYGKMGVSQVTSRLDYALQPFTTRYGACSLRIWIRRSARRKTRKGRRLARLLRRRSVALGRKVRRNLLHRAATDRVYAGWPTRPTGRSLRELSRFSVFRRTSRRRRRERIKPRPAGKNFQKIAEKPTGRPWPKPVRSYSRK